MAEPAQGELQIGDTVETAAGPRHVIGKREGLIKLGL
jgi:hypothetical protein